MYGLFSLVKFFSSFFSSYTDTSTFIHIAALSAADLEEQFTIYSRTLSAQSSSLLRFGKAWYVDESEKWAKTTPPVIHGFINHCGSVMLLYSLKAPTEMQARTKVIEAARMLAEFGAMIRGKNGLKHVHASLLLMVNISVINKCTIS